MINLNDQYKYTMSLIAVHLSILRGFCVSDTYQVKFITDQVYFHIRAYSCNSIELEDFD